MELLRLRRDPRVLGEAEGLFALAAKAWPPSVAARVNRAVVMARRADLALGAGRTKEGMALLRRASVLTEAALGEEPNRYSALMNAGRFRLRLAELSTPQDGPSARREEARARVHLSRAARLHPERAGPRFQLGVLAARQERYAEARRHFQAALELAPSSQSAKRYLERVERLIEERRPR
jgi:tetratricopeptide (TPR) repeat protein